MDKGYKELLLLEKQANKENNTRKAIGFEEKARRNQLY